MSKKKTHEEYVEEVSIKNFNIDVIDMYINSHTKIMHKCKICEHTWEVSPSNILQGRGCPKCAEKHHANVLRKSHNVYVEQVKNINKNILVLDSYIGAKIPIKHKCTICGHEWNVLPDSILDGHGCPRCIISNGENSIQEYLKLNDIEFEPQKVFSDCKNKQPLPFDFYLPSMNVCIEYDGIQHFEPIEYFGGVDALQYTQHNDAIKTKYCLSHNIDLLRIKYDQDVNNELNYFFNNTKLIKEAI